MNIFTAYEPEGQDLLALALARLAGDPATRRQ